MVGKSLTIKLEFWWHGGFPILVTADSKVLGGSCWPWWVISGRRGLSSDSHLFILQPKTIEAFGK